MESYETFQPFVISLWLPSTADYLFHQMLIHSFGRCICADRGLVRYCQVNHACHLQEETERFSQVPGESL